MWSITRNPCLFRKFYRTEILPLTLPPILRGTSRESKQLAAQQAQIERRWRVGISHVTALPIFLFSIIFYHGFCLEVPFPPPFLPSFLALALLA